MARRSSLGTVYADTTPASAISDLLMLALQMGSKVQEQSWRSEEAEKDRQFKEASFYLQNMLDRENKVIDDILLAEEDAALYGYNITDEITRLHKFQEESSTSAGLDLMNLGQDIKDQRMTDLLGIRSDIAGEKKFFNQGVQIADVMDTSGDEILSDLEITNFEAAERARKKNPDYILPESMISGAKFSLADPQTRLTKLQLEGEKTRQAELALKSTREEETHIMETSKFQMDLTSMYRTSNISSMKGDMSYADYEISSGIHQYFKGMSKAEIFEMIENSPVPYTDRVPGELDYSDIDAIEPQMKGFVMQYLQQRPEAQEFLGITQDDFDAIANKETASDNFNFALQQGTRNAMTGFEQNPNYELKSEFIVSSAQAAEFQIQEGMIKDLERTFAATIPTLQNHFMDPVTKMVNTETLEGIGGILRKDQSFKANAKKAGLSVNKYIMSIMQPLLSQADPTSVNLLIIQSEDIKKIIDTSGLQGMDEMINSALDAKNAVGAKYTPVERISKPERTRIKKVTTENIEYVGDISEKYKNQLSTAKLIGLDLIRKGYDPASLQYKTALLQGLALKLLDTTDPDEIALLKSSIEDLQKEMDRIK